MQVKGEVILKGSKNQVTDNMTKQSVIVKTNDQYPQHLEVEFINNKCELLDSVNVGNVVTIDINLRGNLSKDGQKAYVSLQGWKLSK